MYTVRIIIWNIPACIKMNADEKDKILQEKEGYAGL